jgi:ubiquinone/menaquinone biosynthesis C-methylase UbiE
MDVEPSDDFTRLVMAEFRRAVREKDHYTVPWLDLDISAYRACREGAAGLPHPYAGDPVDTLMMNGVQGLEVLCLAGGGGQQSAVFSLLGARVTVLDLMDEQLAGDRAAAAHYGYPLAVLRGDMRDLSPLADASFDRVYQPISTLYVTDLPRVYREVSRVLRPGGMYAVDFAFPLLYMAHVEGWNGDAYTLSVREPYRRGEVRETPGGRVSFTDGEPIGEYHHLLSDIVNGLLSVGLAIRGLWENPRPDSAPTADQVPGSAAHRHRYLPFGLSVVAEKTT